MLQILISKFKLFFENIKTHIPIIRLAHRRNLPRRASLGDTPQRPQVADLRFHGALLHANGTRDGYPKPTFFPVQGGYFHKPDADRRRSAHLRAANGLDLCARFAGHIFHTGIEFKGTWRLHPRLAGGVPCGGGGEISARYGEKST